MGFFSGGTSSQQSFSGLRGTPVFNQLVNQTAGDYGTLRDAGRAFLNSELPTLNESGLFAPQQQGVNVLGQNLLSSLSGSYARMGLNTPQNINAVVGGALTQAAPSLMSQIYQNITGLDAMRANRLGAFQNVFQSGIGALGQESTMRTTPDQFGYTLGTAGMSGIGNWVNPAAYTGGNTPKKMAGMS